MLDRLSARRLTAFESKVERRIWRVDAFKYML